MEKDTKKYCYLSKSTKICFRTKTLAERFILKKYSEEIINDPERKPSAYFCNYHNAWHITTHQYSKETIKKFKKRSIVTLLKKGVTVIGKIELPEKKHIIIKTPVSNMKQPYSQKKETTILNNYKQRLENLYKTNPFPEDRFNNTLDDWENIKKRFSEKGRREMELIIDQFLFDYSMKDLNKNYFRTELEKFDHEILLFDQKLMNFEVEYVVRDIKVGRIKKITKLVKEYNLLNSKKEKKDIRLTYIYDRIQKLIDIIKLDIECHR